MFIDPGGHEGSLFIDPGSHGGSLVIDPGGYGGSLVIDPGCHGGSLVIDPGGHGGSLVINPGGQSPVTSVTGHLKSERSGLLTKSLRLSLLHFLESTVLNQQNFQSHKFLCMLVSTPFLFLFCPVHSRGMRIFDSQSLRGKSIFLTRSSWSRR